MKTEVSRLGVSKKAPGACNTWEKVWKVQAQGQVHEVRAGRSLTEDS